MTVIAHERVSNIQHSIHDGINNKQADSGPARGETWGKMKGKEEEKSR